MQYFNFSKIVVKNLTSNQTDLYGTGYRKSKLSCVFPPSSERVARSLSPAARSQSMTQRRKLIMLRKT